jgi:hypothetical protein
METYRTALAAFDAGTKAREAKPKRVMPGRGGHRPHGEDARRARPAPKSTSEGEGGAEAARRPLAHPAKFKSWDDPKLATFVLREKGKGQTIKQSARRSTSRPRSGSGTASRSSTGPQPTLADSTGRVFPPTPSRSGRRPPASSSTSRTERTRHRGGPLRVPGTLRPGSRTLGTQPWGKRRPATALSGGVRGTLHAVGGGSGIRLCPEPRYLRRCVPRPETCALTPREVL